MKIPFPPRTPKIAQIVALCLLVALAGIGGYLLHPNPPSPNQVPAFAPVPAHASLVRLEAYPQDHVQNWYFTIAHLSEQAGMAFYQAELPQNGWKCITMMSNTNISFAGQMFSGTGVYMTALRGSTKAQIYFGDQGYGAWLLQADLPDDAIGLKLSLEPAEHTSCS